ncbi:tail fiber protein [Pasteurella multocida]|uniref:tail fiber protein n=1 Tax=Pasteurella multocida TaxID=747 RepID=UPI002BAF8EEB|nr:tail fiber protein [Pasteurella multocida]MEB3492818.1 tail fiber protein [Pasteurella multocida]
MSNQAEKYKRKHDFTPYTKADGNAVAEEFDGVQSHLEKVPGLRNDGKGFSETFIIVEPTEDNHPVTYGQLKNAENSVEQNKNLVVQKAEEVSQNTQQVALDTQTTQQAENSAVLAAQTATEKAQVATEKADRLTESAALAEQAKQAALIAESNAREWAVNPEDEQVSNGEFSAYHHAAKARKSAERAEQAAASSETTIVENELTSTSTTNALSAAMGKKLQDEKFNRNEKLPWASISAKPTGLEGYGRTFNGVFTLDHTQPIMIFRRSGNNLFYFGTPSADSTDVYIHSYVHGTNLRFKQDGVYFNREIFANSYQKVIHEGNFQVKQVANNTSANMLRTDGHYYLPNGQNLPGAGAWHLEVISGGATNAVRQIARKVGESDVRERHYNGSAWSGWKKSGDDGMPLGAIVAFPKGITPRGYLKGIGGTFNQETYPDLYTANGNSNVLPNLTRSDVGMTAYFATDSIPDGWISFDSIRTTVTQQNYPELYQYLVDKYGSIVQVPLVEDRFIRNSGNGLNVGETQDDAIRNITGQFTIDDYDRDKITGAFKMVGNGHAAGNSGGGTLVEFNASLVVPTADENRPKSIILKLCIKAKNSFDDVAFWIKAFGEVANTGILDAGTLAQDLQQLRSKTQRLEASFNQNKTEINSKIQQIENQITTLNTPVESRIIWSGNVTQHSTNIIQLSESVVGKTLTFYLKRASSQTLSDSSNLHMSSIYVDKKALSTSGGKKYLQNAMYAGGWANIQIELVSESQIIIYDISSFYLKQITAA